MAIRRFVRGSTLHTLPAALLLLLLPFARIGAQPPTALAGCVTSATAAPLEGVLVRAQREGSNKTVTVVSRADGSYTFPRERLEPGRYRLETVVSDEIGKKSSVRKSVVQVAAGPPPLALSSLTLVKKTEAVAYSSCLRSNRGRNGFPLFNSANRFDDHERPYRTDPVNSPARLSNVTSTP